MSRIHEITERSGTWKGAIGAGSPAGASPAAGETQARESRCGDVKKTVVILAADHVGKGDEDLGRSIVASFIKTVKEMGDELWRLILVNGGVKLAVEGAESLPRLRELEAEGVEVLVCGGCLQTFGLFEKRGVGETTNMVDIVTSMQVADKVISLG